MSQMLSLIPLTVQCVHEIKYAIWFYYISHLYENIYIGRNDILCGMLFYK